MYHLLRRVTACLNLLQESSFPQGNCLQSHYKRLPVVAAMTAVTAGCDRRHKSGWRLKDGLAVIQTFVSCEPRL